MEKALEEAKMNNLKLTEQMVSVMISSGNGNFQMYKGRGTIRLMLKNYSGSINDFLEAIKLKPSDPEVFLFLADSYSELGEFDKALDAFSKVLEFNPYEVQVFINRGNMYFNMKEFDQAMMDYSAAIELNPQLSKNSLAMVFFRRGNCHSHFQRFEESIVDYTRAIELNPNDSGPLVNRGNVYNELKRYSEAVKDFTRVIEITPIFEAFLNRSISYMRMKENEKALQDLSKAIQYKSDDYSAYFNRGHVHENLEMYEQALDDYNKSISLCPSDPRPYYNRARVFIHFDEYEKALQDYSKAIDRNPYDSDSLYNRGYLYFHLGSLDKKNITLALNDFNKCLLLKPREAKVYHYRGLIFSILGEHEKSEEDLKTAEEINPDFWNTRNELTKENTGFIDEFLLEFVQLRKRFATVHFSDLKFVRRMGHGAYAHTYLCNVNGIEGDFVAKIYKNISTTEKMRELLKRDSLYLHYHPNLVSILSHSENETIVTTELPDYDSFWKDYGIVELLDSPLILMKYYPGDLHTFLKEVTEISALKFCLILKGIINGVRFLHKNMIVHRDLHPGNVLLDPKSNRVWICDFGCALDLRMNRGNFQVKKDDEILISYHPSFTLSCDRDFFRIGGASHLHPPEILKADGLGHTDEGDEGGLDYSKYDIHSIGLIGLKMLSKVPKDENGWYDVLKEFVNRFVEDIPEMRIGYKDAADGIRNLIRAFQTNNLSKISVTGIVREGGKDDGESEEEEELEGEDDDDDEVLRKAIELSLENSDD